MSKKFIILVLSFLILVSVLLILIINEEKNTSEQTKKVTFMKIESPTGSATTSSKIKVKKEPKIVSTLPINKAVLSNTVSQVSVSSDTPLSNKSTLKVTASGNSVLTPQGITKSSDKKTMVALINPVEPANYIVTYEACWVDHDCKPGIFTFEVK